MHIITYAYYHAADGAKLPMSFTRKLPDGTSREDGYALVDALRRDNPQMEFLLSLPDEAP